MTPIEQASRKLAEELGFDYESTIITRHFTTLTQSLETRLAYAEDALKNDLARQNAAGMEMRIKELEDENKRLREALMGLMEGQVVEQDRVLVRCGPSSEQILKAKQALTKPT
jgi:hypothetical protein